MKFYYCNFSPINTLNPKKRVYDYTLADLENSKADIENIDIKWSDVKSNATFDAIKQAERSFKSCLPPDMIALISLYNGAIPDKNRIDTVLQTGIKIKSLLSIDKDDPDNINQLKWFNDYNIAAYPIAVTTDGDFIILGRTDGKVYWMSKDLRHRNLFQFIANTPIEFLKKLYSIGPTITGD